MTNAQHIEALADNLALEAHAHGCRTSEEITKFVYANTALLSPRVIADIVDLVLDR